MINSSNIVNSPNRLAGELLAKSQGGKMDDAAWAHRGISWAAAAHAHRNSSRFTSSTFYFFRPGRRHFQTHPQRV
jgi:hypothetical protein